MGATVGNGFSRDCSRRNEAEAGKDRRSQRDGGAGKFYYVGTMRPTWVEISQSALRHNFGVLRRRAQAAGAELVGVIKADAYGHGLTICGGLLAATGAPWLGVTSVEEGVHLRQLLAEESGLTDYAEQPRILVMGGACQASWEHGVPKVTAGAGPRISASVRWARKGGPEREWAPSNRAVADCAVAEVGPGSEGPQSP